MNLRDLKYIVAVAYLKSFVKAAEFCCVSQPTLSMQIKKLEETLGVKIFERSNKHVLITAVGETIVKTARRALQETALIEELAKHAQNPLAGNFKLGAFPTLASYVLPGLTPFIRDHLPQIRLILVEEKTETLIQQLKNGDLTAQTTPLPAVMSIHC